MKASHALLCLVPFCAAMGGCATHVFSPYPDQLAKVQMAVDSGAGPQALMALKSKTQGSDGLLYSLERGRLAQLLGQYDVSKGEFERVIGVFDGKDLGPSITATGAASGLAAMVSNDNAIAYEGEPYERVMTHGFQALNYLGLGKPDDAEVELRRAADQQRDLANKYQGEIAKAKAEAAEKKVPLDTVSGQFAGLDEIAGQVKSSFQNAYVLYLSGAIWEARGDGSRASVDYRQALEMYPANPLLKEAVERVDGGRRKPDAKKGTVVMLYEEGFAPRKDEIKVPVPLLTGGLVTIAFPFYHASSVSPYGGLAVADAQGKPVAQAVVLTNFGALAARALKEKVPGMLVRQTARALVKHQIQKQAGDSFGPLGQIAGNIYNFASESADRRSWLMLPAYAAGTRLELPEGDQVLKLSAPGVAYDQAIKVRARKTTILRIVNTRSHLIPQVFEL